MGNVKGTFGFVDQDGEIKRVSYSSNTNNSESSTLSSIDNKDRSSVVQSIPRLNRTNITTRRPTLIYPQITPSPSSTVIQTIPRRRITNTNTTTTTTERPVYKPVKTNEYEITSRTTTEATPRILASHQRTIYQNGHFIRSTLSPQVDVHRFTEGQLIRPTHPETVTPRPNDGYLRRLIVTRNPLLDEQINPVTVKPVAEEPDDNIRGNLLRRQLNQEKILTDYDARQHILSLHQSTGSDATDVHGGSLTTGTPRPLFTTTLRPRLGSSSTTTPKGIISPAKYPVVFQKNAIRGPRPLQDGYQPESTTDSSHVADPNNYITPTPLPVLQIPHDENGVPLLRGQHLPRGAILIPINQVPQSRYLYDDPNHSHHYPQQHYTTLPQHQYLRENTHESYIQPTPIPRVTPVPFLVERRYPEDDRNYRRLELMDDYIRPYQVPVNTNLQDDIDNIKPPVSTLDFQKLLNRLIIRQNHLKELSRYENTRAGPYYGPQRGLPYHRGLPQPNPISIFVRTRDNNHNGPIQFLPAPQPRPNERFIALPQIMQHRMESQQQYQTTDPYHPQNYDHTPLYRQGRRVGRVLDSNMRNSNNNKEEENYLPADVREMLLLKMLQLAINPNLPLPPSDQELMTTANPPHRKEAVRNVEILGEEVDDENKRNVRSKRYQEDQATEDTDYY